MPKPPNLLRKVLLDGQWKMCPVVRQKVRGDVRYDLTRVLVGGVSMVTTAGTFYLEFREEGRRVRRSVGEDAAMVKAAIATQTHVLELRARGVQADDAPELRPRLRPHLTGKRLAAVLSTFVDSPPPEYRFKTWQKYANALECFVAWTAKTHVVEIEREDIKAFLAAEVRQRGLQVSTAKDKAVAVAKVLRDQGAPIEMRKGDWPRVTKRKRKIYKPEVLKQLFAAADEDEYELFQTFLLTGMREAEMAHFWWPDFDAKARTASVTKKHGIFDPKNYEERVIPIFDELVALLEARRKRLGKLAVRNVFATMEKKKRGAPGGQADGHMLRKLKSLAWRAELNCGRCVGKWEGNPASCAEKPICREFGLHRFRHTYATQMLRDGVNLVSLQKLLGHKDLDSTKEYLHALEPEDLGMKVRSTGFGARFQR